jgi:TolB-like protein/Tfp pilus assembly protein PilF
LVATKEAVTWIAGSAWIDARAAEAAEASEDANAFREVGGLFAGELMEGLTVGEAAFEQWLAGERERFRLLACRINARLMDLEEKAGKLEEALVLGLKVLTFDPLQEHVHRAVMRIYAAQGRHAAALVQYERCQRELSDQLGVKPEHETEELARAIRTSRRSGPASPQASSLPQRPLDTRPRSERPSIAVLPFTNLGSDAEQQYLGDGITEDIIIELSRYRSLLVIARNSAFQFRGASVDLAAVRSQLGVQFVVEGSIRKIGPQVRLTVQLIDAASESHLWAERYDSAAAEIFALQDEITRAIAATLEGRVAASGAERAKRRPPADWVAYDYFLQGREQIHRYRYPEAEPFLARAVELDPAYAQASALRVKALLGIFWTNPKIDTRDAALESAAKALSLDEGDPWCQAMMGFVLTHRGQRDLAGPYFERAVALNPGDIQISYLWEWWLARTGRAEEALKLLDLAMHRDPFPPAWFWEVRGIASFAMRRYDDVIKALSHMVYLHAWDHAYIAACHAHMNRIAEARAAAAEVLQADPIFTVSGYRRVEEYTLAGELEHLLGGMRKAGLPE